MATQDQLLAEIVLFCADAGIPETTFGRRVMSDGKFVDRIRQGGGLTVANLDRIRAYIAAERGKLPELARPKRRRPADGARNAA